MKQKIKAGYFSVNALAKYLTVTKQNIVYDICEEYFQFLAYISLIHTMLYYQKNDICLCLCVDMRVILKNSYVSCTEYCERWHYHQQHTENKQF